MFTESLWELGLAVFAFVGGHLLISSTPIRPRLVAALGESIYAGLYSLLMLLFFIWMVSSYAQAPVHILWPQTMWARHIPLVIMPFASVLLAGSLLQRNPTLFGAKPEPPVEGKPRYGVIAITRHPMLWSFTLWALAHLPANGDLASALLFGGLLFLSFVGTFAIDAKIRRRDPEGWARLRAQTSNIPLVALIRGRCALSGKKLLLPLVGGFMLFVVLTGLHPWLIGVSPLPSP